MPVKIAPITSNRIDEIVAVHMRAFPEFFLTFLGPRFLREFYNSFTYDPAGIGFVAHDPNTDELLGVIVGPLTPQGYFKRLLKKRWWAFCLASVVAVLKRPSVIKRLFRALFYRGQPPQGPPRSLLSSIAVAPEAQGKGIGQALLAAWTNHIKQCGSPGCYLTTDADGNDSVNRFYLTLGWKLQDTTTTPEGRLMNYYVLDFTDSTDQE